MNDQLTVFWIFKTNIPQCIRNSKSKHFNFHIISLKKSSIGECRNDIEQLLPN